jgi:hypothetical protein
MYHHSLLFLHTSLNMCSSIVGSKQEHKALQWALKRAVFSLTSVPMKPPHLQNLLEISLWSRSFSHIPSL